MMIIFFNFIIFIFLSLKPMQNELVKREQIDPIISNEKIFSLYVKSEPLKGIGILSLYPFFYLGKSLYKKQSQPFSLLPLLTSSGIYFTSQTIRIIKYFYQAKKLNIENLEIESEGRINQTEKSFFNNIISFFNIFEKTNTENIKNYIKDIQEAKIKRNIESYNNFNKETERLLVAKEDFIDKTKRLILDYDGETFKELYTQINYLFIEYRRFFSHCNNYSDYLDDYYNELEIFLFNEIKYSKSKYSLNKKFFLLHWIFESDRKKKDTGNIKSLDTGSIKSFIKIIKDRIQDSSDSLNQEIINSALLEFREKYIKDIQSPQKRVDFFDLNLLFPLFRITIEENEDTKNQKNRIIKTLFIDQDLEEWLFTEIDSENTYIPKIIKFLKDNNISYNIIRDYIKNYRVPDAKEIILSKIDSLENLSSK